MYSVRNMTRPSQTMSVLEREKRLNTKALMELVGVTSRQSIWRQVKEGTLPKPVYLKPHVPRWKLGVVLDWLEGYEESFDAEVRAYKGDQEKLDEFQPEKNPKQTQEIPKEIPKTNPEQSKEGDSLRERLKKKYLGK